MDLQKDMVVMLLSMLEGSFDLNTFKFPLLFYLKDQHGLAYEIRV